MAAKPNGILTRSCCDKIKCPRRRRLQLPHDCYNRSDITAGLASRNGVQTRLARLQQRPNLLSLPREVHLAILGRLGSRDLHTVRQVSVYFEEIARDPMLWKDYEVFDNKLSTHNVINDLKRMPFLKKICISNRIDCDEILRQISVSNKNLEQLSIINCTGSTSGLQLRASNLTRIVKRCRRLHTFQVLGTRFRGQKLFRLMGEAGSRLRSLEATTTRAQVRTFIQHASYMTEEGRYLIALHLTELERLRKRWSSLEYRSFTARGQPAKIFVIINNDGDAYKKIFLLQAATSTYSQTNSPSFPAIK